MTVKLGGIETEYTDWGTPAVPALRQLRQEDFEYPESQSDPDFFIPGDGGQLEVRGQLAGVGSLLTQTGRFVASTFNPLSHLTSLKETIFKAKPP